MKKSFGAWAAIVAMVLLSALASGCGGGSSGTSATLVSLSITPADPSIAPGTSTQFTAIGTYSNHSTQNITSSVTWTTSNKSVVDISNIAGSKGLATASSAIVSTVTTTITAASGSIQGSFILSTSPVSSMTITPSSPFSIAPGTTQQFAATGILANGASQVLTIWATWDSLNTGVATFNNISGPKGLATAVDAGTAAITATYNGVTSPSATLTSSHVASILVTSPTLTVPKGLTQQFTATGTLVDSTTQGLTTWATWSTSNAGVATISNVSGSKGLATAVAEGSTNITALFDSVVSSSATLTVTPAILTSIAVTPISKSIALGLTQQYLAIGTYSDSSTHDITSSVTWSSSQLSIATMSTSTNGLEGSTTITASLSSITSNSATLTVTPSELVSIFVTPISPTISFSSGITSQKFTATGTFTYGTPQDLSASVTWASTNPNIPISTTGLATDPFFVVGSTSITASLSGKTSNTATLTFIP